MRLFTRGGQDWTRRYPLIVEAALRNRTSSFVIDGEPVLLGVDGISGFNGLQSRRQMSRSNSTPSTSWRSICAGYRCTIGRPTRAAAGAAARGYLRCRVRTDEIGQDLFRKACEHGLEGLVAKGRDSVYRSGRSPSWIKARNRAIPGVGESQAGVLLDSDQRPERTK